MAALKMTTNWFSIPIIAYADQRIAECSMGRMLHGEHSAILSAYIKLSFVIKIFILSIFEWPFYTGFTVILIMD